MTYALLTVHYHKNPPRNTFQHMYANLLSSKITQHEFTKGGNFTEIFSSETFIETNNTFAVRSTKPFQFQLRAHNRCHKAYAIK